MYTPRQTKTKCDIVVDEILSMIAKGVYKENEKGWIFKDGILSEAYGLNTFETIIDNALVNINDSCIVIASHVFSDNFISHINKKIEL